MDDTTELKAGELYWVVPPWDVDAPDGYYNMWQPARYMGLSADGQQQWRYIGVDQDEEWFGDSKPRFLGPHLPMHADLAGGAWAEPFDSGTA